MGKRWGFRREAKQCGGMPRRGGLDTSMLSRGVVRVNNARYGWSLALVPREWVGSGEADTVPRKQTPLRGRVGAGVTVAWTRRQRARARALWRVETGLIADGRGVLSNVGRAGILSPVKSLE